MVKQIKDPVSSLQRLGSLLWLGFDPWPRNIHVPQNGQKEKGKRKRKEKRKKTKEKRKEKETRQ